jgi:alpha-ketoglutarate-dependent taurine dioxygenase
MNENILELGELTQEGRLAVKLATARAVEAVRESGEPSKIDAIALIINDHEGAGAYGAEIWINETTVVERAVQNGVPRRHARWLYENWLPEAAKGVVLQSAECPTFDRTVFYSIMVCAASRLREVVQELTDVLIVVDNNHDYDGLVISAVRMANPGGQAAEWLAHPPPDC